MAKWGSKGMHLLLGWDGPKAHWIMDLLVEDRQAPYAMCTALGWIIHGHSEENVLGSYIATGQRSIEKQLSRLYNEEFRGLSLDHSNAMRENAMVLETVNRNKNS